MPPRPLPTPAQLLEWVERISMYLARDGVSPIAGRIVGWLMICDPAEQSAEDIANAIRASRASLTTNLQMLTAMGLVSRLSRPGGRTAYYRIVEGAWDTLVQRQIMSLAAFRDITQSGLALVGSDRERAQRIREADQTFAWMAEVFAKATPPRTRKKRS